MKEKTRMERRKEKKEGERMRKRHRQWGRTERKREKERKEKEGMKEKGVKRHGQLEMVACSEEGRKKKERKEEEKTYLEDLGVSVVLRDIVFSSFMTQTHAKRDRCVINTHYLHM